MTSISLSYKSLISDILGLLQKSRSKVVKQVNFILVETYRNIGKQVVEYEQKGKTRADYGDQLLKKISKDLKSEFGRGFSWRNLYYMKLFYISYPKLQTVSAKLEKLSRSHFVELLSITDSNERNFYEIECGQNAWSVRELRRQIDSSLYERLALSKEKGEILYLAKKGQIIQKPTDILKDPYLLEFLGLSESKKYSESDLESAIIDNLGKFLLELGKGFTFVSRQQRISNGPDHWYIDLVFYNRLLQCFVLIDLKIGKITPQDLGQMQLYVNRYDREVKSKSEKPTVGLILCKQDHDFIVEYTLPKDNKQIFAREYKLYLPDKKELREALEKV